MSATLIYNLIGFFGLALAVLFFILPPDKPKRCSDCPNAGTGKKDTGAV